MKKGILLYKSKYGATKKYVDWMQERAGFDAVEVSKAKIHQIQSYETILLMGGIYASGIAGLSFLRKHFAVLKNKKLAIFCVGASPYDEAAFEALRAHNLKEDLKDIPVFYGRGSWDQDGMTCKDRLLCTMLQKMVAKKAPDTYEPWEKALMCAVGQKCDWTDPAYLKPLLDFIE